MWVLLSGGETENKSGDFSSPGPWADGPGLFLPLLGNETTNFSLKPFYSFCWLNCRVF